MTENNDAVTEDLSAEEAGDRLRRIVARASEVQLELNELRHARDRGELTAEQHAARAAPRVRLVRSLLATAHLLRECVRSHRSDAANSRVRELEHHVVRLKARVEDMRVAMDEPTAMAAELRLQLRVVNARCAELTARLAECGDRRATDVRLRELADQLNRRDQTIERVRRSSAKQASDQSAQLRAAWDLLLALRDRASAADRGKINLVVPAGYEAARSGGAERREG